MEDRRTNKKPKEYNAEEIEGMRRAARVGREVLDAGGRAVAVGVTCDEIDRVVHEATISRGAYPSPLNYHGFPKSVCTSVNEVRNLSPSAAAQRGRAEEWQHFRIANRRPTAGETSLRGHLSMMRARYAPQLLRGTRGAPR